jgi:hypothetical protein
MLSHWSCNSLLDGHIYTNDVIQFCDFKRSLYQPVNVVKSTKDFSAGSAKNFPHEQNFVFLMKIEHLLNHFIKLKLRPIIETILMSKYWISVFDYGHKKVFKKTYFVFIPFYTFSGIVRTNKISADLSDTFCPLFSATLSLTAESSARRHRYSPFCGYIWWDPPHQTSCQICAD